MLGGEVRQLKSSPVSEPVTNNRSAVRNPTRFSGNLVIYLYLYPLRLPDK